MSKHIHDLKKELRERMESERFTRIFLDIVFEGWKLLMQNWDSNTKNPIIPNFALCSLDLSYIWVQNLVTQINLTENQIFCEVEDLQLVPLECGI